MQCEGWRRYGGIMTFGPVKWEQCKENATAMLKVDQEKVEDLPACPICWKEVIENKITILGVTPL